MARLSTVAAFGFDDFDPPVILDLYRRLGCTSCQFYRNPANPPTVDDVLCVTRQVGLPVDSMHGVFGPEHDPSSTDDAVRARAVRTYRAEGELATQLGGPMVVVHPSPFAPEGRAIHHAERARRVQPLRRSMEELARIGETLGVTYLFENNPGFAWIGNDPLQIAALVRELDSPFIRMCFDTGHANMTGPVAERLALCADVVAYLHVHDNDGQLDNHQLPGRGSIDWPAVRQVIRSTGLTAPVMLELFYLADELEQFIADGVGTTLVGWLNITESSSRVSSRR